jgi:hypothetical protein
MGRWVFAATLILVALCPTGANAARTLLADLMARASAEAGGETMSALVLEACLRRAQELDNTGTTIDYEIAAIDREAAEGVFLQNQLNAELSALQDYDERALKDFQRRAIRHDELAKKFQAEFPLYQKKQRAYNAAVTEFEHSCAGNFSHNDLEAVKSKLDLK